MARSSIFNVLDEHVIGVIVRCVCGRVGDDLLWRVVCGYCLRCGQCHVRGLLLLLVPLSLLAKFVRCCVDTINE